MASLRDLQRNLEELAKVPSRAASEAAEDIDDLIQRQFDEGKDPYGTPWAPLVHGGRSYLQETEQLRESIEVRPMAGAGIRITCDSPILPFHQNGTLRMPARPVFPEGQMPKTWTNAVSDALERNAKKALKR